MNPRHKIGVIFQMPIDVRFKEIQIKWPLTRDDKQIWPNSIKWVNFYSRNYFHNIESIQKKCLFAKFFANLDLDLAIVFVILFPLLLTDFFETWLQLYIQWSKLV